jgi:GAF domain-containing protein
MKDKKYAKLADFGRQLLTKTSLMDGLPLISEYAKEVIVAERCSIFIYDEKEHSLWTTLADGIETITVDSSHGIIGYTLQEKKALIVNEPYKHEHFLAEVDRDTGYITKNIITAPIFNSKREIIGVLELLNKVGGFDGEDLKFVVFFAHYISGFLELAHLYSDADKRAAK